jgi:hypothetical protein
MRSVLAFLCAAACGFAQSQVAMPVDKGQITLLIDSIHLNTIGTITVGSILEGSLRNDTNFQFETLHFELIGYNDAGQDLRLCDQFNTGSRCDFYGFGTIRPGETIRLRYPMNAFHPDRPVPKGQRLASVGYRVIDALYRVKYRVESSPVINEKYTIQPMFDTRGIALEFRSLGSVIEVLWDQSSYIDEDGSASRLIRSNVRLSEKDRPQPSTVIPPGTKLQETVFPIDRIKQKSDGSLYQDPLFPEVVQNGSSSKPPLDSLVGKEVRLFLRLLVDDQKQNVTIAFKVAEADF